MLVRLAIFDPAGREVRRIADGAYAAGHHDLRWDGRDAAGRAVPNGLYFFRLQSDAGALTRGLAVLH
jgi:flagellar hook assembly protein FlgD